MRRQQEFINLACNLSLEELLHRFPIVADFLSNLRLDAIPTDVPLTEAVQTVNQEILEEFGLDGYGLLQSFCEFMDAFTPDESPSIDVTTLTILGGRNKMGEPEEVEFTVNAGEVISIVGPTGSGKSRLLNDIECLAQNDTPTRRKILVNGAEVDDAQRFEMEGKLVAQLSQNMNFVMDLTVREFLEMHAKSRLTENAEDVIEKCFVCANDLAGEKFELSTKVTQLSGGQSRALMIADTAFMSNSPIVLIDEIENAGIDRRRAIELLAKRDKIVFVSTHDPLLALSADKRIVIKNGGIFKVIEISSQERQSLHVIEQLDNRLLKLRERLRAGELIVDEEI